MRKQSVVTIRWDSDDDSHSLMDLSTTVIEALDGRPDIHNVVVEFTEDETDFVEPVHTTTFSRAKGSLGALVEKYEEGTLQI